MIFVTIIAKKVLCKNKRQSYTNTMQSEPELARALAKTIQMFSLHASSFSLIFFSLYLSTFDAISFVIVRAVRLSLSLSSSLFSHEPFRSTFVWWSRTFLFLCLFPPPSALAIAIQSSPSVMRLCWMEPRPRDVYFLCRQTHFISMNAVKSIRCTINYARRCV